MGAIASNERMAAKMIVEIVIIFIAEYRATNQLDNGRPITKPADMANNTAPNSAFDKCSCRCISGILDDHVEEIIPDRKKNIAVVHLILFLTCIRWL